MSVLLWVLYVFNVLNWTGFVVWFVFAHKLRWVIVSDHFAVFLFQMYTWPISFPYAYFFADDSYDHRTLARIQNKVMNYNGLDFRDPPMTRRDPLFGDGTSAKDAKCKRELRIWASVFREVEVSPKQYKTWFNAAAWVCEQEIKRRWI